MSDRDTTTRDTGPKSRESSDEAAEVQSVGGMCCGFAEMGRRMRAGEMPDCCGPGASQDPGGSEADETSTGKVTT